MPDILIKRQMRVLKGLVKNQRTTKWFVILKNQQLGIEIIRFCASRSAKCYLRPVLRRL